MKGTSIGNVPLLPIHLVTLNNAPFSYNLKTPTLRFGGITNTRLDRLIVCEYVFRDEHSVTHPGVHKGRHPPLVETLKRFADETHMGMRMILRVIVNHNP